MPYKVCTNTADVANNFATLAAIAAAANTWNAAGARFQFTFLETACNSNPRRDNVNQIGWIPADVYPAATYVWKSGTTILESDTTFNDQYKWSVATPTPSDSVDIQTVALHELGHALGLDHAPAPAIMQPSVDYGEQRRVLDTDDKNGIVKIYGCR
jgi:predicted Zn-dependent protease